MTCDARQIANWFVQRAARDGRALSIMSLLKLVYISHGWHLEMFKAPLFENQIEAWQYGPVIPDVYNSFRKQGIEVRDPAEGFVFSLSPDDEALLEQIYDIYGNISPFRLSELTHEPGGPWAIARELGGWYAPIPNNLIQSHYEMKRLKANDSARASRFLPLMRGKATKAAQSKDRLRQSLRLLKRQLKPRGCKTAKPTNATGCAGLP